MSEVFGFDAYAPKEIAERIAGVGVTKARLPVLAVIMLGILAGGFIGFGALYFTLVTSDASLGYVGGRLLGALCFCLGLLLVVVAGAELFTGNNLLVMAWADGTLSTGEVLRNWTLVCLSNAVGAFGLALLVLLSGHLDANGGAVGRQAVTIAVSKLSTSLDQVFIRAVLCNMLVCLAVWMSLAGRSVTDKAIAIVFPVSAFVAAGFEHSVANMYLLPLALMKQAISPVIVAGSDAIGVGSALIHTVVVILGNVIGGAGLVAVVYHLIYRRAIRP
ncbi:MAG: formate/nitrite transporter family protein [Chloroflexota bacterium]